MTPTITLTVSRPTFTETFLIKPTITGGLWEVVGSVGNTVRKAEKSECIRWAEQLGLRYEVEE